MNQRVGTSAAISLIAAIGSFAATCTGHPFWGLLAAAVSIPAGGIGLAMSASPRIRGGFMSLAAIGLGLLGMIAAILGMVGLIVF